MYLVIVDFSLVRHLEMTAKEAHFLENKSITVAGAGMAGLAFDLGMHADALKWDQGLPDSYLRQKDVQLRTARALTKVFLR